MSAESTDTAEGQFVVPDDDDVDATPDAAPAAPPVDLTRTPGPVVAAVAFGVVAAPLLGVYAVLFISRYFLKPGVTPDITGSWTGEGVSGLVAAVLAVVLLVIVARTAGGRARWWFVGAEVLVVAASVYLFLDADAGGRPVSAVVAVLALAAVVAVLLPPSRRWFDAHAADRAALAAADED